MRKIFALVLIVASLLTTCSVCADEVGTKVNGETFSIRNGIKFGMSREEIQNLEKKEEKSIGKISPVVGDAVEYADILLQYRNMPYGSQKNYKGVKTIYDFSSKLVYKDKIVGQEGAVIYHFNDSGLVSLQYLCEYSSNMKPLTDSLQKKYGEPLYTSKAPFEIEASSSIYLSACREKYPRSKFSQISYVGWLLIYDDSCVLIEAECFDGDNTLFWECVTYTAIPMEDYNKFISEAQNSVYNDL